MLNGFKKIKINKVLHTKYIDEKDKIIGYAKKKNNMQSRTELVIIRISSYTILSLNLVNKIQKNTWFQYQFF